MGVKKALIVLADGRGISTFPPVYQSAIELKNRNWNVSIITESKIDDSTLEVFFDSYIPFKSRGLYKDIYTISRFILKNEFQLVIAFEPRDARYASVASLIKKKTTFVYYNIEIELNRKKQQLSLKELWKRFQFKFIVKTAEKTFTKNSSFFVIQDHYRLETSRKYGINHSNIFLLPNSYNMEKNLRIESAKTVEPMKLLYCGGLEEWSVPKIMNSLESFNSIHITFSGWSRDNYLEKVMHLLEERKNISVLQNQLSLEEYTNLVLSHDIGLVWYSIMNDNIYNIGRSSGKFFKYLSCGKPVIVQNLPGLGEDVKKFGLGIVLDTLAELPKAVLEIQSNYEFYRNNVIECYKSHFDYKVISKDFFDRVDGSNR